MSYNLFLDDSRRPKDVTWILLPRCEWVVVKTYDEFVKMITARGLPLRISFDHDLADEHYEHGAKTRFQEFNYDEITEKTGMCCAKWLIEYCLDNNLELPEWTSHTMNPCGRVNIDGLLNSFKNRNESKT